jgi:hypothetical protein
MQSTQQCSVFKNKENTTVSTFVSFLFLQTQRVSTLTPGHYQHYNAPASAVELQIIII